MNDKWVEYFEKTRRNLFDQSLRNRRLVELIEVNAAPGSRILEAGCGTALLSLLLADKGYELTALDLTEEVLQHARSRMALKDRKIDFVQGDIMALSGKFPAGHFAVACHSGVMEHFPDDLIVRSLREQRAVAQCVVFSVPNIWNRGTKGGFGDERYLSNAKWTQLIRAAGFEVVDVYGGYDLPMWTYFVLPGAFFHRKGSFWWKYFSRHSLFVCR
jgi:2-polyprenyl-3-methyl-5-hydroxy-6-metoxy-1,4-benzoquinol methylase